MSYRLYLETYFGGDYPLGAQALLGATGRLAGTDLVWLYHPFLSALLALCVPSLLLLGELGVGAMAWVAAIVASVPALVYAYALMGAIKEIALLPLLLLLAALLAEHRAWLLRGVGRACRSCSSPERGSRWSDWRSARGCCSLSAIAAVLGVGAVRGGTSARGDWRARPSAAVALLAVAALPLLVHLARPPRRSRPTSTRARRIGRRGPGQPRAAAARVAGARSVAARQPPRRSRDRSSRRRTA